MIEIDVWGDLHGTFPVISEKVDHNLMVGDFTDSGEMSAYLDLSEYFIHLKGKVTYVYGNHDYGYLGTVLNWKAVDRANQLGIKILNHSFVLTTKPITSSTAGRVAHTKIPLVYRLPVKPGELNRKVFIIAIDSCALTPDILDFATGNIGDQLSSINSYISLIRKDHHDAVIILLMHHDPFTNEVGMGLTDAVEFNYIIAGRIDVLVHGHTHKTDYHQNRLGIPHIISAGLVSWSQDSYRWRIQIPEFEPIKVLSIKEST